VHRKKHQRYKQGDIYWYDFGPAELEGVMAGLHPCVIISNDLFNRYSPVVDILAVSSQKKRSPVHVLIPGCLNGTENFVYCEQWVTASKKKLTDYLGNLDGDILEHIIEKLIYHITYRTKLEKNGLVGASK
jgi:mRNA-degrading endonuclease toxin of MazEF toxin-antitoxin module